MPTPLEIDCQYHVLWTVVYAFVRGKAPKIFDFEVVYPSWPHESPGVVPNYHFKGTIATRGEFICLLRGCRPLLINCQMWVQPGGGGVT